MRMLVEMAQVRLTLCDWRDVKEISCFQHLNIREVACPCLTPLLKAAKKSKIQQQRQLENNKQILQARCWSNSNHSQEERLEITFNYTEICLPCIGLEIIKKGGSFSRTTPCSLDSVQSIFQPIPEPRGQYYNENIEYYTVCIALQSSCIEIQSVYCFSRFFQCTF